MVPASEVLTSAGHAVLERGFDNPDWKNGFEHDLEEATRVLIKLLHELAVSSEQLVATHLPFRWVCHVGRAATPSGLRRRPGTTDGRGPGLGQGGGPARSATDAGWR